MQSILVDGIWILKNKSGICLFEEIYTDFKKEGISKDLISGFLSAIVSFTDECFKDELKYIKFKNHKILLDFTEELIVVVAVSIKRIDQDNIVKKTTKSHIKEIVKNISQIFNERFHFEIKNEVWEGDLQKFGSFSQDLQNIVNREPLKIKLILLEKKIRKDEKREERRKRRMEDSSRLEDS